MVLFDEKFESGHVPSCMTGFEEVHYIHEG